MNINSLEINDFRNIKKSLIYPSKNINIFYGENANGKTSYLESIYSVSNLKSFRTSKLYEAINVDSNSSKIKCVFTKNNCNETINLHIKKNNKIYTRNNKKCGIDDYLWSLLSIVFKPEDVSLVSGPSSKRRDLIDKAIFFNDKRYINVLKKYYKIISNKNINLKNNKINEIDEWNKLIAKYSAIIVSKRNNYILKINNILNNTKYKFKFDFSIINNFNIEEKYLENYFIEEIKKNLNKEIKYKYSIVGAHKQNIDFYIDNKELKIFGSQGQKRTFILLFRSAQILDIENENNFSPILLLDDIASELDYYNKNVFLELAYNFKGQTFITTTDENLFSDFDKVKRFCVEDGNISSFS